MRQCYDCCFHRVEETYDPENGYERIISCIKNLHPEFSMEFSKVYVQEQHLYANYCHSFRYGKGQFLTSSGEYF